MLTRKPRGLALRQTCTPNPCSPYIAHDSHHHFERLLRTIVNSTMAPDSAYGSRVSTALQKCGCIYKIVLSQLLE